MKMPKVENIVVRMDVDEDTGYQTLKRYKVVWE